MTDIFQESLQELFIALTTRWRRENGKVGVGVAKSKLLKAGEIKPEALDDLLQKLRAQVAQLGLEVVEYIYEGEVWYAVRSTYVCPTELSSEEEAVLAVVIANLEASSASFKQVPLEAAKKKLLAGKYFSPYQLDRILKRLEELGYVEKRQKMITYSPRTLLEFSEESRKHIAEQAKRLIF